jgi:hypothetical protein
MPQPQSLEGAIKATAISFQVANKGPAEAPAQGFLAIPIQALAISGLPEGNSLQVPFRGLPLKFNEGGVLELNSMSSAPMQFALALPAGILVDNLHFEGSDQLIFDLLPASANSDLSDQPEIALTPPVVAYTTEGEPASTEPLKAVFKEPGQNDQPLNSPKAQFRLPLNGATRLRLQLEDVKGIIVFEPNLLVQKVLFSIKKRSLFDQTYNRFSTIRSGTLHLGRQEPLTLRLDQFLNIDPPGIGELTDLRAENGLLHVGVVGETSRIRAGLSPGSPSTMLQGTLLSRHLSTTQITGFWGFLAGVISSLFLMLFKAD